MNEAEWRSNKTRCDLSLAPVCIALEKYVYSNLQNEYEVNSII
jgi:hypothetical protein